MQCYPLTAEAPEKYVPQVVNQCFYSDVTLTSTYWQLFLKNALWQQSVRKHMPSIAAMGHSKVFIFLFLHLFSTTCFPDHAVRSYQLRFSTLEVGFFTAPEMLSGEAEP